MVVRVVVVQVEGGAALELVLWVVEKAVAGLVAMQVMAREVATRGEGKAMRALLLAGHGGHSRRRYR